VPPVFISWSTPRSESLALALRDWLPQILQAIEPFVSSEDIAKGSRWSPEIAKKLEESEYGLICVTAENVDSRWLNFESGALAQRFEEGRVCPLLLDHSKAQLQGPLAQFQSATVTRDDLLRLVKSINDVLPMPLRSDVLEKSFSKWWPDFDEAVKAIAPPSERVAIRDSESMLSEVLELVRALSREAPGQLPFGAETSVSYGGGLNVEIDDDVVGVRSSGGGRYGYDWYVGDKVHHEHLGEGVITAIGHDSEQRDVVVVAYGTQDDAHYVNDSSLTFVSPSPKRKSKRAT
jgi:hypothetical protein